MQTDNDSACAIETKRQQGNAYKESEFAYQTNGMGAEGGGSPVESPVENEVHEVAMEEDPYESKFKGNFDENNSAGSSTNDHVDSQSYVVREMQV